MCGGGIVVALGVLVFLVGGCSSGGGSSSTTAVPNAGATTSVTPAGAGATARAGTTGTSGTSGTGERAGTLRILVSNDDGIGAPGIDALVVGLRALPATEVVIAAPATNQSGVGEKRSATLPAASPATTASGVAGTAVAGTPADAVTWALDGGMPTRPHVVVSGVNFGQNVGPSIAISGTVGAARTAAKRGIPAVAVSQGLDQRLEDPLDYRVAVGRAIAWVEEHRAALLAQPATQTDPADIDPATVDNINVPTCRGAEPRGRKDVPVAADTTNGGLLDPAVCDTAVTSPVDDIQALNNGWITHTEVGAGPPAPAA